MKRLPLGALGLAPFAAAPPWRRALALAGALGLVTLATGCGRVDETTCSFVDPNDSREEVESSLGAPTETDVGAFSTVAYYGRMADEPGTGGCCRVVYDGLVFGLFAEERAQGSGHYYPDGCERE